MPDKDHLSESLKDTRRLSRIILHGPACLNNLRRMKGVTWYIGDSLKRSVGQSKLLVVVATICMIVGG